LKWYYYIKHTFLYFNVYFDGMCVMSLDIQVINLQNIVNGVVSQWEPLLKFFSDRRLLLGMERTETIKSFIHRVETAHVWTQGLTVQDFIDEIKDNDDIKTRVEKHLQALHCIQKHLIDANKSKQSVETTVTRAALQLRNIIFPNDRRNYFNLVGRDVMYETLRMNRLSLSGENDRV
jgi:hypothetical protein